MSSSQAAGHTRFLCSLTLPSRFSIRQILKYLLPALFLLALCITKQFNGLWEFAESRGWVERSDAAYQFAAEMGNNLTMVILALAVWRLAHGPWRTAGMFACLALVADTSGLILNPSHYDSWLWELLCAIFAALVTLIFRPRKRVVRPEVGSTYIGGRD